MSSTGITLLESVLALPEADRVAIAEAVLSSLPDDDTPELDDEAFTRELRRRSEEMKNDPSASISWSELKELS